MKYINSEKKLEHYLLSCDNKTNDDDDDDDNDDDDDDDDDDDSDYDDDYDYNTNTLLYAISNIGLRVCL